MTRARAVARTALAFVTMVALFWHGVAPAALRAQANVPTRAMTIRWQGRTPTVSFSARDFLNADVRKKLGSGLPQRIVTRVYAYPERGERPIVISAAACRVVYDLWEGVYRVEEQTATIDRARNERDMNAAVATCLEPRNLALGDDATFAKLAGKRVYFGVIVELNPLSADTVQRIRRWLSRAGGELSGDAFFGSFVSIFVSRKLGAAERALSFRSSTCQVP